MSRSRVSHAGMWTENTAGRGAPERKSAEMSEHSACVRADTGGEEYARREKKALRPAKPQVLARSQSPSKRGLPHRPRSPFPLSHTKARPAAAREGQVRQVASPKAFRPHSLSLFPLTQRQGLGKREREMEAPATKRPKIAWKILIQLKS